MAMSDDPRHSKYGLTPRLDHAEDEDLPVLSGHAHDQWDERMPADAVSAETALERAYPDRDIVMHGHWAQEGEPPDAIWLYRGQVESGRAYTAAFIERSGGVTTVLRPSLMQHRPMAVYLREKARVETYNE